MVDDLCDESGSLCLARQSLLHFTQKLTIVMMCKHMDDGVLVGPDEALDRTLAAMGKILLLKTSSPQLGSERGFLVKPLAKLFDSPLSSADLENYNPVHSPGV